MSTAQYGYKKDFYENIRTLPTFKVIEFVYVDNPPSAFHVSEVNKAAPTSYNELMVRVSDPYKIDTGRDKNLTILEDCVENTISIHRATKAPSLQEEPGTNGGTHHPRYSLTPKQTMQIMETMTNLSPTIYSCMLRKMLTQSKSCDGTGIFPEETR